MTELNYSTRLDLPSTPGLPPIGLSPGSWQTSLGLGSMSRYSAQILICIIKVRHWNCHINGLVQDCGNSSSLAMELLQSSVKPSISSWSIALASANWCKSVHMQIGANPTTWFHTVPCKNYKKVVNKMHRGTDTNTTTDKHTTSKILQNISPCC